MAAPCRARGNKLVSTEGFRGKLSDYAGDCVACGITGATMTRRGQPRIRDQECVFTILKFQPLAVPRHPTSCDAVSEIVHIAH